MPHSLVIKRAHHYTMTNLITYGTYDLLHQRYRNLFRRVKGLIGYLKVGATSDSFDHVRGKLNVFNIV